MKRNFDDFIEAYLDYAKNHESTRRVQLWSILSVLAGAMERKVWVNRGYYTLYPNLYVFIVGKSGLIKKSTSTGMAVDLLREVPEFKFMSERMTAAALIDQMTSSFKVFDYENKSVNQSPLFAYASEAIVFLGEVFGSVIELLTTFYDCQPNNPSKPWVYHTKAEGQKRIYGPCLNILGASTKSWLKRCIPTSEMEGGFTSRCLFVVEENMPDKLVSWPEVNAAGEEKKRKLIEDLIIINELVGEATFTPETRMAFDKWYHYHMNKVVARNKDPRFSGYLSRKGDILLKLALIRSVSLSSDLVVNPSHLAWAGKELESIEPDMMRAFADSKAYRKDPGQAVINFITSKGGKVKKTDLDRQYGAVIVNLDRVLFDLVKSKRLVFRTDGAIQYFLLPT